MGKRERTDTSVVPEMLTVEEAACILRIGRTAAYELANRWLGSGGTEGIPARRVGRLIRVPTAELEEHFHIRVTADAIAIVKPTGPKPDAAEVLQDEPPTRRRRAPRRSAAEPLPFARPAL